MKQDAPQLEILLMIGATFSSRQYCEKESSEFNQPLSEKERLEEACWNGLIQELLPCFLGGGIGSKIYIWKVRGASSFIEVEMGQYPKEIDRLFSIYPYSFADLLSFN